MSAKRLGKGLGALIPSGEEQKIESQPGGEEKEVNSHHLWFLHSLRGAFGSRYLL